MTAVKTLPLLLVEDDENDILFLQRAFQQAHILNPLHVARDGQEAIEYLSGEGPFVDRKHHPLPGIIILDFKMPRRNGLEVLEWLRRDPALQSLPVLVLSSSAQHYDVERCYRLGANAFLVKPSDTQTRAALARAIKDFWLTFNEPPLICTEGTEAAQKFHAQTG